MEQLVNEILSYMKFLNRDCNLSVTVHIPLHMRQNLHYAQLRPLLMYNVHTNPYCMMVKRNSHHKCIVEQTKTCENSTPGIPFCRICHAGVHEYISPIDVKGVIAGFIAVSGYRKQEPPTKGFDKAAWEMYLEEREIPIELCDAVIPPLRIMLKQLFENFEWEKADDYGLILHFLDDYHTNVKLDDLCQHLGRSPSYISHLFKRKSGLSVREYCNQLKLEDAKNLLQQTNLPITEVAFDVGFNDVSYFIMLFRKKYGMSPLRFRKEKLE